MEKWDRLTIEEKEEIESLCPECGEEVMDDERVKAGMKCAGCSYGGSYEED